MLGSIIGDVAGSIYEFDNIKTKDFELLAVRGAITDDSIMTLATADWLLKGGEPGKFYVRYANENPRPLGGYGTMFAHWLREVEVTGKIEPYNSCGNGSAMRVGPVGWVFNEGEEDKLLECAKESAACTHNHPEGVKGAQADCSGYLPCSYGQEA